MEISGSCSITLSGTNRHPIDARALNKIQGELTDILSAAVDELMARYGFENQQIHSCMVDDLEIEE